MPVTECVVDCPIFDSFRVQQVAGMFDVSLEARSSERFTAELPSDDDWTIGVIVGPSGSGKSTIAKQAFGSSLYQATEWPSDRAVVDCFGNQSIKKITAMLTAVGFSSPPAWVRPYHVLSNGQKFRCDLARAMLLSGSDLVAFDEFTSVVDRTVAKIGSAAIAKSVRSGRTCKRFVAVSCHYDIVEWLEPDWVLDMASGDLARGRLWRRPPIRLHIYATSHRHWRLFAKHHYLDTKEIPGATCYVAEIDDVPVCFVAIRSSLGHKGTRRISRIVTMPDFQGVGVGMACLNTVADITAAKSGVDRVTIVTGHPAMMHALNRSERWKLKRFMRIGALKHSYRPEDRCVKTSTGRCTAAFEFIPRTEDRPKTDEIQTVTNSCPALERDAPHEDSPESNTTGPRRTVRKKRRRTVRNR